MRHSSTAPARDAGVTRGVSALAIAVVGHLGLGALAMGQHAAPLALVAVTEIELAPPPAPDPPRDEPPREEPQREQPTRAAAPHRARAPARAPAEPLARASAVRTVDEAAKTADEPVRFVTDPSGASFGYGAVQRGGTAESAPASAPPPVAAGSERVGKLATPVLSRPPRLAESDPCRGFFPSSARVDRGEVALRVRVERDGSVRTVTVGREMPVGHGFGPAARACLLSKHFAPALDESGHEIAVVSPVTVRFSR